MGNFLNSIQKLMQNKMMRTFIIGIFGIIVLIIVIAIIASNAGKVVNENNLVNAAKRYISANPNAAPTNDYDSRTIGISVLVANGYLNEKMEGVSCYSSVTVTKMDNNYYYTPLIDCNNESDTVLLRNVLTKNIVSTGSGLYYLNNEYIFRGDTPNNYLKFGDIIWRIVGIDKNNNIKIIYYGSSPDYESWDDRYNSITDSQDGINDYSVSRIKEYLDKYLSVNSEIFTSEKKARLSKFNVCTGKANLESNSINTCNETTDSVIASIVTVSDYMNASLDASCSATNTKNCQNYNFLNKTGWTLTANNKDTTSVYYITDRDGINFSNAYIPRAIRTVIALRNDIIYVSGTGSESDPYIIK